MTYYLNIVNPDGDANIASVYYRKSELKREMWKDIAAYLEENHIDSDSLTGTATSRLRTGTGTFGKFHSASFSEGVRRDYQLGTIFQCGTADAGTSKSLLRDPRSGCDGHEQKTGKDC